MSVPRPVRAGGVPDGARLLLCSLWLRPVLFGFGTTSWIGFAVIGVLVVRIRWILLAGLQLFALVVLETGPADLPLFLERTAAGYFDLERDAPLLVLYLVGVAYGLHASRVWLRILWGRRERGQRMLGWAPAPTEAAAGSAVAVGAGGTSTTARTAADRGAARAAVEARAAHAFRALLVREEAAARAPEAPAPPVAPPSAGMLPREPLDVRTAALVELAAVPAIGPTRAALLVAARGVRPLDSIDDVFELLDLPAADLIRVRPYLRF
jgi:hypothetical protein